MHPRLLSLTAALALGATVSLACTGGGTGTTSGTSGAGGDGGAGGDCPMGPQAMFTLTITAEGSAVPSDTRVVVSWSAGTEPTFSLDDKESWKTLEESNLVCDVDPHGPPPSDLPALVCHVWSNGATKVEVSASGYAPFEETYVPMQSEHCHGLVPTQIEVKLTRAEDAGTK